MSQCEEPFLDPKNWGLFSLFLCLGIAAIMLAYAFIPYPPAEPAKIEQATTQPAQIERTTTEH